jgi:glycosyltransferase involved in cell wall biosynthesis
MKKVLFFTQNRWAFGSLHTSLCKELYKHNISANILDEDINYSKEEYQLLNSSYDLFVTNPDKVLHLHKTGNIPLTKIITIAHAQWDLYLAVEQDGLDFFDAIKNFAVISNVLIDVSKKLNIKQIPKIVSAGISFSNFYTPVSNYLQNIGYGGIKKTTNFFGQEIKRGYLVEKAIEELNVNLISSNNYNFLCMPGYYKQIDCLVMSSLEEAGGLPILEAAAAGRLVIGTPVGYFEENGPKGGGVVVPLEEDAFIEKTKETILFYKNNPTIYKIKCQQIQQYARDNYDWSKKIEPWLELLS